MLELDRLVGSENEDEINRALRPRCLKDYVGQNLLKEKLLVAIQAAKERKDPVPHILLIGPPGLGKTTLANIIGKEYESNVASIMGPSIKSVADILELLKKLDHGGILFIDEVHSLDRKVEETLYSAMEDNQISVKIADNQIVKIKVNPFCLIGATTLPGKMTAPLRDRFDMQYTMQFYEDEELATIIAANAVKLGMKISDTESITDLAKRSRGTPRIANRLLKRVRDYAQVKNNNVVNKHVVQDSMNLEGIDENGLNSGDVKYLKTVFETFKGGPVGLDSISAAIQEDKNNVAFFIEPFLMRKNLIIKDKRGRSISDQGLEYLYEFAKVYD